MNRMELSDLWDAHTRYEFSAHDLEATLATMVEDAYVNHIPTMTGGYGKDELRVFYGKQFIPTIPPDFKLTSISRTRRGVLSKRRSCRCRTKFGAPCGRRGRRAARKSQ